MSISDEDCLYGKELRKTKNLKKLPNTVHFAGCGAFMVHRQLDIVASSGHAV